MRLVALALCLLGVVTLAACSPNPDDDWFGETMHPGQRFDPGTN
jgi:hypothetical protein